MTKSCTRGWHYVEQYTCVICATKGLVICIHLIVHLCAWLSSQSWSINFLSAYTYQTHIYIYIYIYVCIRIQALGFVVCSVCVCVHREFCCLFGAT